MLKTNGKSLYKLAANGTVERVVHKVQLEQARDHYYHTTVDVDGRLVQKKIISARGWELIGRIAGIGFVKPEKVTDENGILSDNPIIRRKDGVVEFVRIRNILLGRGENGNLRAIDLTLSYDVTAGLANQLFERFLSDPHGSSWGDLVNADGAVKALSEDRTLGKIGIGGGNFLIYSLTNSFVRRSLKEHTAWALIADRSAATIVERNLMRRFFGFCEANDDATVEFTSWPMSDIPWQDIQVVGGNILVDGDTVSLESFEEKAENVESDEVVAKGRSVLDLIKEQTKRIGGWSKSRAVASNVLTKHNMRWGDIGACDNSEALEEIYQALRSFV